VLSAREKDAGGEAHDAGSDDDHLGGARQFSDPFRTGGRGDHQRRVPSPKSFPT